MPRFIKKPVEIEAVKITAKMTVETLEGVMTGEIGDWLITGVEGEQYFCKPSVFEKTYEAVMPTLAINTPLICGGSISWPLDTRVTCSNTFIKEDC